MFKIPVRPKNAPEPRKILSSRPDSGIPSGPEIPGSAREGKPRSFLSYAHEKLPAWLQGKANYDIWQRTNLWLREEALSVGARETALIALWDGAPGDGPGGTQHLTEAARGRGVIVKILSTKEICRQIQIGDSVKFRSFEISKFRNCTES